MSGSGWATAIRGVDVVASARAVETQPSIAPRASASRRNKSGFRLVRLESTIRSLAVAIENTAAAESRIRDVDFASETAELTRNQVLQQAGVSILSQANVSSQSALTLLQ